MFTDWASIESAASWQVAAEVAGRELAAGSDETWEVIARMVEAALYFGPPLERAPAPRARARGNAQLGLFEAMSSVQVNVETAIDPFNGPCVVCGEPGRRRNTMPAAIAAVMPPIQPTCRGHELVCDWGIPLSADHVSRMLSGELPGVPVFRYRAVRGSKAAAALKPAKAKAVA